MHCKPSYFYHRNCVFISIFFTPLCLFFLPAATAQRKSPGDDAFPLVARAIRAKHCQQFVAREEIVLFHPAAGPHWSAGGATRIVADVIRDGPRVRLSYILPPATAHRVVVDDGHAFQQWEPTQHLILEDRSHEQPPKAEKQMLQMLHLNYQCRRLHHVKLNGHDCDMILIHRRHQGGGDRRLWIERSHSVILRTEEYDTEGKRRYLSFYEAFHFGTHIQPRVFRIAVIGPVRQIPHLMCDLPNPQAAFSNAGLPGRLPAWLPCGYAMIGCALATFHGGGHAAVLRYGDGLQTFCVFEERGAKPGDSFQPTLPPYQRLTQTGQQVWEAREPGIHIVIIGDAVLPSSLGTEMLQAFDPNSERRLLSRLASVFGPHLLATAMYLRQKGWRYDQIVSFAMYLQAHPERSETASVGWEHDQNWRQKMSHWRVPTDALDQQARQWISDALTERENTD